MTLWLVAVGAFGCGAGLRSAVQVRRYSRTHMIAQVALRGRGLFFSRTPDGTWWKLRLRARKPTCSERWDPGDTDDGCGVREPRRPRGPLPTIGAGDRDPR
jgi:hypothetical protein